MKKILLLFLFISTANLFSQNYSCSELVEYAKSKDRYPDIVTPITSSMLSEVGYYSIDNNTGFVIAYIKENEYDFKGNQYIFCGVSSSSWSNFKRAGITGSYGKAFHKYIMNYTCNCY